MCGIAGAFAWHDMESAVRSVTDALRHRGPDDVGMETLRSPEGVMRGTFGHRRLAILDLSSAGHQPMVSADGRYCLTYNGEIYNFRELRTDLESEGANFRGTGDTEVLLAGWVMYGTRILEKLRGMFAFAIWDRNEEKGYLARDAFGIKPLYITESGGAVLFASEIRALLESRCIPRHMSREAVASYLAAGSVAEPLTIIDGVRAVPAGCVVEIAYNSVDVSIDRITRFASALPYGDDTQPGASSGAAPIRDALRDSVSHHLVSDVPLALFLSGGIDSSSVVAVASEVSQTKLDTFTITFAESEYSEREPAGLLARHFGTTHHEVALSGSDLLNALPDVFAAMDQPSLDGLNTYIVSRAVRAYGIKVVLSGLGGDELFAGYPSFKRASYAAPVWKLPGSLRRMGAAGAGRLDDLRAERLSLLLQHDTAAEGAYNASRTLFGDRYVRSLMSHNYRTARSTDAPAEFDTSKLSVQQQVSFYEVNGYMRNTLLRDSDVFSMVHGLELRVPFVDREVARAAFNPANTGKPGRSGPKPLLVDAVKDLLPESVVQRPKQGFTLPFEKWMRNEMFSEVDSMLSATSPERAGLDHSSVKRAWREFQERRPGMNWSRPWALYTLMRWASLNDVTLYDADARSPHHSDTLALATPA